MIGDDIVTDIGGAQACGLQGVQVRTGKYRYVTSGDLVRLHFKWTKYVRVFTITLNSEWRFYNYYS